MDVYYGTRKLDMETQKKYARMQGGLELDCERRALVLAEKFDLPIDRKEYAKAANAYITFYYGMHELKGWCGVQSPYEVPEILDAMPDTMDGVDYDALAMKTLDLYRPTITRPNVQLELFT